MFPRVLWGITQSEVWATSVFKLLQVSVSLKSPLGINLSADLTRPNPNSRSRPPSKSDEYACQGGAHEISEAGGEDGFDAHFRNVRHPVRNKGSEASQ